MAASTPRLASHERPWCNKAGLVRLALSAKSARHQWLQSNELMRLKHVVAARSQDKTSLQLVSSEGTDLDILSRSTLPCARSPETSVIL